MSGRKAALAAGLILWAAPAFAGPVEDAITARDVLKLEELGRSATAQAGLAQGAALSLRHKDDAALAILEPLALAPSDSRAGACWALADIYLRQGRYADTRQALQCAKDSGLALTGEALQVLSWSNVLAAEKPMRLARPVAGKLDIHRDDEGLVQTRVSINGQSQRVVIDTDSSFCVLSQTVAERLGVRILDQPVTITTSSRPDQPMRLGIADEVAFGDAVLTNVVFAVLPDAAVDFGRGYRMNAVIGLPVFVALGRIELASEGGTERLYYGARPDAPPTADGNMLLSGLDPFALVKEGRTGAVLRLAIDTAAQKTTLNALAFRDYPALAEGTSSSWAQWQGAGGRRADIDVRSIPELKLSIAGRPIALVYVKVLSTGEADRHGAIGQDAFRHGWMLDFGTMSFALRD